MYSSRECYNDTSCDCIFITDICNNNVTCEYDTRFSSLIGYDSFNDPVVRDISNVIHPDDLEGFRRTKNSVSKENPFESLNLRMIKKDRTVLYVRCSLIYTTTDDNYERIIYAFSVLEDSEYFRQSAEFIKTAQPLMFKFRSGEKFPYFYNDSFLKVTGYTREEAESLNLSYTDFMNSHDVDHFVHAIRSAAKSDTISGCTVRIIDRNRKTSWVSCSFKKMISPSGEEYFIGIGEDVTENKKAENDLLKNRMLLKNLTENLSCATFALNADETKAELIRANQGFLNLFGYTENDAEKFRMNFSEILIHPNEHSDFIHGIMRTGTGRRNICRAITGDGRTIWTSFASFSAFEDDRPCYVCTFHDVTSLQETENELEVIRNALIASAAQNSDIYCTIDFNEKTLNFPEIFAKKYSIPEVISAMPEGLFRNVPIHESYRESISALYNSIKDGSHSGECTFRLTPPGRNSVWLKASVTAVSGRNCSASKAVVIVSDVSEQMGVSETEKKFSETAKTADSTIPHALVPKDIFRTRVNDCLRTGSSEFQALYVLDINGFMNICKKHGKETGESILDAVSEAVLQIKRPCISGKMYGDEFVIFISDITSHDDLNITAKQICNICRNITLPPEVDTNSVTGCVGVAYAPVHGNDFDTLYKKAEASLQSAKKFDRTRYAIYSEETVSDARQLNQTDFREKAAETVRNSGLTYHLYNADIKHFRNFNHSLGYEKGNRLLQEICSMIQEFLKPGEYFTRLFADNFLLLTLVHDTDAVKARMDEINYRLQNLHITKSSEVQFAAGYVIIDDSNRNTEFEQLIDCSIVAHEKAKEENGTSFVRFEPGMSEESMHRYEVLSEISDAVRNGQICTFVQPQYDIIRNEYVSMEALVRWNHPVKGLLQPDSFVSICEENGLVSMIDFCVLEQMCSFIKSRIDSGLRVLPVAVNQSQVTIHEKGYVRKITALVEKYNIPPKYIELEVTESACVNNLKETIRVLSELREYGFRISMDDFGTGYSTLNFLKDMPVDALKIDKTFLTRTLMEKKPAEIIKSITGMAHNINIRVICEGVEFPQQVQFLSSIGCELVQGFLFGKPMPYTDVNQFIDSSLVSWGEDC